MARAQAKPSCEELVNNPCASMFPAKKKRLKVCFIYIPLPILLSSMNVPLLLRSWISIAPFEFFLMTNWSLLSWWRDFFGSWSSPMRTSLSVALPTRINPTGLSASIPLVNSTLRKSFCKEKSTPHWNRDKIESIVDYSRTNENWGKTIQSR